MVRSQERLAEYLLLLRRGNMFIALIANNIALLRSAMWVDAYGYKHVAPPEQSTGLKTSPSLDTALPRAYSPETR